MKFEYNDKTMSFKDLPYVKDRFSYTRAKTREVKVGDLGIGGCNPIRVQTMTISDTQNVAATVDEAEKLAVAGCELVRITAPSLKDAECLKDIRKQLNDRGCRVPLCADIHFTPKAALLACEYVEKVRVNPGNFADKKVFAQKEYTDQDYREELERIFEKFSPLVLKAKQLGRALRIGTNHGSLSDRVLNRYGDTPLGMVESALEFVEICRHHAFHDLVISMKASNPKVMIQAYRLLVARMNQLGYDYPLHLGVTEAGAGEDGRLKSAVGIGALLEDGLGDTVRVSLTEDAIYEVPVVFDLIRRFTPNSWDPDYEKYKGFFLDSSTAGPKPSLRHEPALITEAGMNPYEYHRRQTELVQNRGLKMGDAEVPRVQIALNPLNPTESLGEVKMLLGLTRGFDLERDKFDSQAYQQKERTEIIEIPFSKENFSRELAIFSELYDWNERFRDLGYSCQWALRLPDWNRALLDELLSSQPNDLSSCWLATPLSLENTQENWAKETQTLLQGVRKNGLALQPFVREGQLPHWIKEQWGTGPEAYAEVLLFATKIAQEVGIQNILPSFELNHPVASTRMLVHRYEEEGIKIPILLREPLSCPLTSDDLRTATVFGALLSDGMGDAICVRAKGKVERNATARLRFAYNLLQAAGNRIHKTEFVSCPSCGRTLFDLQVTTQRIQAKVGHLKGMKLAIMGCIVNGPGEMADAHFGYVGAGPGRINLYVGKECVQKNIPSEEADQRLIDLIKAHDMWIEPPQT